MSTRSATRNGKSKKPFVTTLGKASFNNIAESSAIDLSHVRKPIDTSIFGLRQVLTLFETATDEVRQYITYECDIMYECRICRTIYRSLANFILHKRNYCSELYNPYSNCEENELYIHQEEESDMRSNSSKAGSRGGTPTLNENDLGNANTAACNNKSNPKQDVKEPKGELDAVIHHLADKQESSIITKKCLEEDHSNESNSSVKEEMKNNITLQKIYNSNSGIFQTMVQKFSEEYGKMDHMRTEVMEIHNILENNEAIIGVDGKVITSSDLEKGSILKSNLSCTVCNQKFSTRKTLNYHVKYKHNDSRLIYQCPECNDTFANTWGVFRHLYKIHRKTMAQVKKLRNQVHANVIRRDQQLVSKDCTTKNDNITTPADLEGRFVIENKQWMVDFEGTNNFQRCSGCGRKFERKAAFHSHSQFCKGKKQQAEEKLEKIKTLKGSASSIQSEVALKKRHRRKPLVSRKVCHVDGLESDPDIIEAYTELCKDKLVVQSHEDEAVKMKDEPTSQCNDQEMNDEAQDYANNSVKYFSCNATDKNSSKEAEETTCKINDYNACSPANNEDITEGIQQNANFASMFNESSYNKLVKTGSFQFSHPERSEILENNFNVIVMEQTSDKNSENSTVQAKSQEVKEERIEQDSVCQVEISTSTNHVKKRRKFTLETKSSEYMNKEKLICCPCNRTFKCLKLLMKHMAVHFNWVRYECGMCSYRSYTKSKCLRHVQTDHGNHKDLKHAMVHISNSKTLELSTDFVECPKKKCHEGNENSTSSESVTETEKRNNAQDVCDSSADTSQKVVNTSENNSQHLPDGPDSYLRKMIMEVIFGSGSETSRTTSEDNSKPAENTPNTEKDCKGHPSSETTNSCSDKSTNLESSSGMTISLEAQRDQRPIRNRTIPVQKDFLYDMRNLLKPGLFVGKAESKKKKCRKLPMEKGKKKLKSSLNIVAENKDTIFTNDKIVQDINMNSEDVLRDKMVSEDIV